MNYRVTPGRRASCLLLATLPIRDTGQHSRGGGNGPAEASARGVVRKVRLSALLAGTASDIEVGVEQQRVAGSYGVGDRAEAIRARTCMTRLIA